MSGNELSREDGDVASPLRALGRRYESTEADYRAAFAKLETVWVASENRLVARRIELLQYVTTEEWHELNKRIDEDWAKAIAKAGKKAAKKRG